MARFAHYMPVEAQTLDAGDPRGKLSKGDTVYSSNADDSLEKTVVTVEPHGSTIWYTLATITTSHTRHGGWGDVGHDHERLADYQIRWMPDRQRFERVPT